VVYAVFVIEASAKRYAWNSVRFLSDSDSVGFVYVAVPSYAAHWGGREPGDVFARAIFARIAGYRPRADDRAGNKHSDKQYT
jgi:hypothetical protein